MVNEEEALKLLLDKWNRATNKQKQLGRTWYLKAHDYALFLSFKYEVSLEKSAGTIAALSPRNKWADNKKDAASAIEVFKEGGDIHKVKLSSTHPNRDNVVRILNGVNPDKTLGQKSKSFYRCIYNPLTDEVCVDVWAARALNYTEKWIAKKDYPILQSYYQKAAKEVGTLPPIMQATVWIVERGRAD